MSSEISSVVDEQLELVQRARRIRIVMMSEPRISSASESLNRMRHFWPAVRTKKVVRPTPPSPSPSLLNWSVSFGSAATRCASQESLRSAGVSPLQPMLRSPPEPVVQRQLRPNECWSPTAG